MRLHSLIRRLLPLAFLLLLFGCARADGLSVHFMNIERNDGILILCDGEAAFIDSGLPFYGDQAVDYLRSQGVPSLKYYIGTHAHRDHVGGGGAILSALPVGEVVQPHDGVRTCMLACARDEAERQAIQSASYRTVRVGDRLELGGATLTVIGPPEYVPYYGYKQVRENFNSLVILLQYGENRFLLTADAYSNTLKRMERSNPGLLQCDVFKNPHHNAAVDREVLEAAQPSYVVYSTDDRHLPSRTALRLCSQVGAAALVTSARQNGCVVFHSDGQTLTLSAVSGPQSVSLREESLSIYEGKSASLHASLKPAGYLSAFVFTSLDPTIASVDGLGKVTGLRAGETTVRASASNGVYAECRVCVSPATPVLNRSELTIRQGSSATLRATIQPGGVRGLTVEWLSDDPTIATVTDRGKVVALRVGETQVRARLSNGQEAACRVCVAPVEVKSVSVSPSRLTLTLGEERALTARVSPANATDPRVFWSSADPSIASVDGEGRVTALGLGKTTITARAGEKERVLPVTVLPVYVQKITLHADRTALLCGVQGEEVALLTASVLPENATIPQVAWKSSNTRVAVVDGEGRVTAVSPGCATIYAAATDGSRRSAALRIQVRANQYEGSRARSVPGQITLSAKLLRYVQGQLQVVLFANNQSGETLRLPDDETMRLLLATEECVPARFSAASRTLRHGATASWTLYYSLSDNPSLAGLNLPALGAALQEPFSPDAEPAGS